MKNKLGIGYITCNAPDRVAQTFPTIPKELGEVVVVNSGCILPESSFEGANKIIQSGSIKTVSVSKNNAIRHLMSEGCEHIFLIEDDIIIKDAGVFNEYVKAASVSGIWHLNYALQGGLNRSQDEIGIIKSMANLNDLKCNSQPAPRSKLAYNGCKLAFYPHAIGSFSYFYKGIIKNVGYFDERYTNAIENIDYVYRVIQKGLHPPYYWFADIDNSEDYLESLPDCMINSVLRESADFGENMLFGRQWFKGKFDVTPEMITDTTDGIALKRINELKFKYARNVLGE